MTASALLLAVLSLACSTGGESTRAWGGLDVVRKGAPVADAERIVVLFHGFGAPGDDLVGLSQRLRAGNGAAFVMPAGPYKAGLGKSWGRDESSFDEARASCVGLLHDLRRRNPSAPIVLGGFSQGGQMAGSLLFADVDGLEAAILMSPASFGMPEAHDGELPPVLITHGEGDQVVPISSSSRMRERLRGLGAPVTWFSFDGGHSIPGDALQQMNTFLTALRLKAGPGTSSD